MATHSSPYDWADTNFARRSILTANAVPLAATVSNLPARFRLPRAADAGTEPDILGNSLANRNDVVFTDTAGNLLKWEFTNVVSGVGFLKWPTLTAGGKTDQVICYYDYAGASNQQSSGSDIYGPTCAGWWAMDEGTGVGAGAVTDRSGNGNHGTPTNMEEGDWVAGPLGDDWGLRFDGTNEELAIVGNPLNGLNAFSIAFYVNFDHGNVQGLYGAWVAGNLSVLVRDAGSQTSAFYTYTSAQAGGNLLGHAINKPVHLVFTYDGSKMRAYADGILSATTYNQTGNLGAVTSTRLFGGSDSPSERYLTGVAYSAAAYASALSASEVAAHNLSLRNRLYSWGPEETQG